MEWSTEAFNRFIIENNVIGLFEKEKILKSKRKSNHYANWRGPAADAFLLNELARHVIAFSASKHFNTTEFYGVPEGATKLGVIAQIKSKDDGLLYRGPGRDLIEIGSLLETSNWIIENVDLPSDTTFMGYPANSIAKELGIVTQHLWAKNSKDYAKGSHVMATVREKAKGHGDKKDSMYLGQPSGNLVLIIDEKSMEGENIPDYVLDPNDDSYLTGIIYMGKEGKAVDGVDFVKNSGDIVTKSFADAKYEESPVYIEDVTTTSISSLGEIAKAKEKGIYPKGIIALTNRMELTPFYDQNLDNPEVLEQFIKVFESATGEEYPGCMAVSRAFEKAGVRYENMSTSPDILKEIVDSNSNIARKIEEEYKVFGVEKLLFK